MIMKTGPAKTEPARPLATAVCTRLQVYYEGQIWYLKFTN